MARDEGYGSAAGKPVTAGADGAGSTPPSGGSGAPELFASGDEDFDQEEEDERTLIFAEGEFDDAIAEAMKEVEDKKAAASPVAPPVAPPAGLPVAEGEFDDDSAPTQALTVDEVEARVAAAEAAPVPSPSPAAAMPAPAALAVAEGEFDDDAEPTLAFSAEDFQAKLAASEAEAAEAGAADAEGPSAAATSGLDPLPPPPATPTGLAVMEGEFDDDSAPTMAFDEDDVEVAAFAARASAAPASAPPASAHEPEEEYDDNEQTLAFSAEDLEKKLAAEGLGGATDEHTRVLDDDDIQGMDVGADHTSILSDDDLDGMLVAGAAAAGGSQSQPAPITSDAAPADSVYLGRDFGGFQVVRKIAAGGMATVFLARREGIGRFTQHAAIKVVHPHMSSEREFVAMFLDEARVSASLAHPNVCRVLDFGTGQGTYYLAMEYVHGETWGDLLVELLQSREGREALPNIAAHVLAQACEGLHSAHGAVDEHGEPLNIVHRDISPQNIFVAYDGTVRVLDFGVASAADRLTTTRTGTVKGRLAYMSPEQMMGDKLGPSADVWSLGVLLRESLEGRRLFRRDSEADTMMAVASEPLPTWQGESPSELRAIADRALERDREVRYVSARDMGLDLTRHVTGQSEPIGMPELSAWMNRLFGKQMEEKQTWLRQPVPEPLPLDKPFPEIAEIDMADKGALSRPPPPMPGMAGGEAPEAERTYQPTMKMQAVPSAPDRGAWIALAVAIALAGVVVGMWVPRFRDAAAPPTAPAPVVAPAPTVLAPQVQPLVQPVPAPVPVPAPEATPTAAPSTAEVPAPAPPEPEVVKPVRPKRTPEQIAAAAAARKKRAAERAAAREAEANAPPGTLLVAYNGGWAEVYYKGKLLGTTPGRFQLPAGKRQVVLKPQGTGSGIRKSIQIKPGETTKLRVD